MNFLPAEVQLDIFKYLDSDQLLSFQQTNLYFKSFINKYKEELARKKFCFIEIRYINENYLNDYIFFKPEPKLYDIQLMEICNRRIFSNIFKYY
ncbi:unnamed protein product [Meloidogyne enterolobii]|uniref:Uncharacterized protein n=1 Tax=Meloidogyne enterolobii TaxID=390850 RepID=A0ACB0YXJ3_MELEN